MAHDSKNTSSCTNNLSEEEVKNLRKSASTSPVEKQSAGMHKRKTTDFAQATNPTKRPCLEDHTDGAEKTGRWTAEEHKRFIKGS